MSRPEILRSDYGYWHPIATRWSDLDALNHVNNTRYYSFDEDARLAYFSHLWRDDPRFWKDYGFILAQLGCDFIAQVRHPAQLDIGFRIAGLGRSSMRTEAAMYEGEKLVAVTRGVLVWFDYGVQAARPIPEAVREQIRAREPLAPQGA